MPSISFFYAHKTLSPLHTDTHTPAQSFSSTASLLTCKSCKFIWLLHILQTAPVRGEVKSTTNYNFRTRFGKRGDSFHWSYQITTSMEPLQENLVKACISCTGWLVSIIIIIIIYRYIPHKTGNFIKNIILKRLYAQILPLSKILGYLQSHQKM